LKTCSRMRRVGRRAVAFMALLTLLLAVATPALADRYDSDKSGHLLRFTAYMLHPVGVMLDVLIVRPAHWMVSHDSLRILFGHTEK